MSSFELNRVELMGRVGSGDLKLNDGAGFEQMGGKTVAPMHHEA